jgi:hypothetical protein
VAKVAAETSAAKTAASVAKSAKAVKAAAPAVESTTPPSRASAPASDAGQAVSKSLCISGKLPSGRKKSDYEDALHAVGITLVGDVFQGLTYLVLADPASTSSKAQKARALGVQILSEAELGLMTDVDCVVDAPNHTKVKVIRSAAVEQQLEQATALKGRLIEFLSAALSPVAEPGKRKSKCKGPPKKHDLVQTLELSAEAWQPIVEVVNVADLDRTRSLLSGPFFTSDEYPIPVNKHGMLMPVAQLDLRHLSCLGGPDLGDGLFQLWCDHAFNASAREVVRVIPRADVQLEKMTSFAFVLPEFDVTPIDPDLCYDPDAESVKLIAGFQSLGMQCQTGYLDVYTEGLGEAIHDPISEDLEKYKEITSFKSQDVQIFGSFYPIQYSAADIGMPCLVSFRNWGSAGNAQVFYASENSNELWFRFEESLR